MSAEADSLCGASYGERSSERTNQRNGYRTRAWDTRAGTVELAIPKLRQGSALADGAVSEAERQELDLVATLLHLPLGAIEDALTDAAGTPGAPTTRFELPPGALVVFTGEMDDGREAWEQRARQAGYLPHPSVTKKVSLLVAADPDTLSGKACKARANGIPIVTPDAFARMLG